MKYLKFYISILCLCLLGFTEQATAESISEISSERQVQPVIVIAKESTTSTAPILDIQEEREIPLHTKIAGALTLTLQRHILFQRFLN